MNILKFFIIICKKIKSRFFSSQYLVALMYSFKKLLFFKNERLDNLIFKRTITKFFLGRIGENKYNFKIYQELEKKFSEEEYFNFNNIMHPKLEEKFIKGFIYDFLDIYYLPTYHKKCVVDEGPYFYDKVQIKKNDVVIDAGANTGIFSAIASNLEANVFAFEPLSVFLDYLKITSSLNPRINIIPLALSNSKGEIEIKVDNKDLRASSIVLNKKQAAIELIKTITLDEWVQENKISKIDFIKADIEGAERLMLEGSIWVLKNFQPKLSISAYHLEDDVNVLTEIIYKANPRYTIVKKWEKIFAWVNN